MKNRIKELREKNNLTLKGLGKKVGLADFFGVSVPYLQGYVEINIPNDLKFESKQDAVDCIEKIMKALGISKEDLRTEHENENS